ncbi:MAG: cupredoxin domain-containing protein [Dermatophilaceae bacterium]
MTTVNRPLRPRQALRRGAGSAALALALLPVAGCSGGGSSELQDSSPTTSTQAPAAAGVVLTVTGTEYSFGPSTLKASAGKTTIRFTNKGAVDHDFSIDALDVHLTAKPGKTAEATVILKPGTYKSHCSLPGHTQSGMRGTLTVS